MMRIGMISDTHIPQAARELPRELLAALKGVDLIFHGGDIYERSVLDVLETVAPVLAARGDDDYGATVTDKRVKDKHILNLEGKIIWLVHEKPFYLGTQWWHNRIPADGDEQKPDIVVFGHEHRTVLETVYDTLFVSPGSPTFLHYLRGLGTIGIMTLNSGNPEVDIRHL